MSELRSHGETRRLLLAANAGDRDAAGVLSAALYQELRRIAAARMRAERRDNTLQPTALVHEAYLRLAGQENLGSLEHGEFLALAARLMRRVLVDHAKGVERQKRGGGRRPVTLHESALIGGAAFDVLDLEDALEDLARLEPRHARLAELRLYGGMSDREAADSLGVSKSTVEKDWRWVRTWLRRRLRSDDPRR